MTGNGCYVDDFVYDQRTKVLVEPSEVPHKEASFLRETIETLGQVASREFSEDELTRTSKSVLSIFLEEVYDCSERVGAPGEPPLTKSVQQ